MSEISNAQIHWSRFSTESLPNKYQSIVLDYGNGKVIVTIWGVDVYLSNVMVNNKYFNQKCRWISLTELLSLPTNH